MYEKEVTEIEHLIGSQNKWRDKCINLIASENVVNQRVQAQAGSDFAHRYAEGHPGERYYRGTSYIDEIENQLKTNLKIMFECDHSEVRPISGTNANEAVFSRLLCQGDVVMVNSTPGGGHISHHKEGAFLMTASTHKTYFGSQRGIILSNMEEEYWRKIDRGAFPGSSSNHHLDTLAQMGIATYEMMEFGEQYAEDTIKNARALAAALDSHGFDVQGKEFGFTDSHQVAVNVKAFRGGERVSKTLELNDIILNMNMLPHEPLRNHDRPEGIRIGVQEMTRFGMGEKAMGRIAELIKECIIDKKPVKEEVNRFRAKYKKIKYSYDSIKEKKAALSKVQKLKN